MKKTFTLLIAVVLFLFSGLPAANAATINVPGDYSTIQAAVFDALAGDEIHVYPGIYSSGTYIIVNKQGLKIIGVDASGVPITSATNVLATVGPLTGGEAEMTFHIIANDVTISGIRIADQNNKAITINGDNFTLANCKLENEWDLSGAIYFYDATTGIKDPVTNKSAQKKFTITGNIIKGWGVVITDGTGCGWPVADRVISNNTFGISTLYPGYTFYSIGFRSVNSTGWCNSPVGGAVIIGNNFADMGARGYVYFDGNVPAEGLDFNAILANNTFAKGATMAFDPLGNPRPQLSTDPYAGSTKPNLVYLKNSISNEIAKAQDGDVIYVVAGTYNEQVIVTKSIAFRGPNYNINPNTTSRVGEAIITNLAAGRAFSISAGNTVVSINGFKFDGGSPMHDGNETHFPRTSDVTFSNNVVVNGNSIFSGTSTSWKNVIISNNKFQDINGTATASAMQLQDMLLATVTDNAFANVNYAAILLDGVPTSLVSGNTINTTGSQAIQLGGVIGNATIQNNTITNANSTVQGTDRGAIRLYGSAFSGAVMISNNIISGGYTGIAVKDGQNITGKNITVTNNSITGLAGGKAIYNGGTGTLNATCNWYGTVDATAVAGKISGPVDYIPYSISDGGACIGGIPIVTKIGTPISTSCNTYDVPVTVADFSSIGTITHTLNYNTNELELLPIPALPLGGPYAGITLNPAISAALPGILTPGTFKLSYSGAAINLADDAVLYTLHFKLLPAASGGTTPLTWNSFDEGCQYSAPSGDPVYVSTFNNLTWSIPVRPVKNTNTGLEYCKIQDAIDDVATHNNPLNPDVITVAAGTYSEDIIVNKSLTILGPNASINPCGGTRVAEAIVVPFTNAPSSGEIFHVAASNVTIKGFTIDGDNPSLPTNGYGFGGADMHAAEGITVYETGINNLTVQNNILKNLTYFGVTLYDYPAGVPSSGHIVTNNKFEDLGTYDTGSGNALWGGGVLLYNNQYTAITNNCMTNVRIGIQTGNFSQVNPGSIASQVISGNTIQARKRGIFHNLFYNASPYTISGNTITGVANANETTFWDGMLISSMTVASTASVNNIDGSAITAIPTIGISVWNCQTAPLISGGIISGVGLGVNVNNFESYPSTGSDSGNTSATIDGVTVNGATIAGIRVNDNPSNSNGATVFAEIKNIAGTGNATGILVNGADAGANIHNNAINATAMGINVNGPATSATNTLAIMNNAVTLSSQLSGTTPTVGVSLTNISGTQAALISTNNITGPFYGYMIYNLNTATVTTITGGAITGIMQGVAALNINPLTGSSFAPSTFKLDGQTISGFTGTSMNPNINFHAGVYVFTGGSGTADVITANVNNVSVTGTGNIQGDCAGLSFADFSTGAGNRQNITVTACNLNANLNRGINVRGANALIDIATSTLNGNGYNPFVTGGNDGFGIIARANANVNIHNCFITNPASTTNPVTAILTDGATITAIDNFLDNNGNTTMGKLAVSGGVPMAATCNWLGSTVPATNAALIAGPVSYNPWLCAGTDVSGSVGFQGVACNSGAPVVPAAGASNVECLSGATPPATPDVKDVDGITNLIPQLVSTVDFPNLILCEGTRTYTYSFTNCSGFSTNWSYVYTIDHTTAPVLPANGGTSVECLASITTPVPPTGIVDVCGVSVLAVPALIPYVDAPASLTCEGTRTYSWTYTDCAGLVSTWNYVYTIDHTTLPKEIGGPVAIASTVQCESSATPPAPTSLPAVQDVCGNVLTPATPVKQLSFINTFDAPVVTGSTAAPGVWYTDRYAPAGFATASFDGGNRLKHSIAAADFQGNPSFYSTQGRGYDVGLATNSMEVKLFIPLAWKTSNKRMAGLWGVAVDASNAVSGYPIVEFTSDGGVPRFRVWESNGTNNWVNLGLPAGFAYDTWITLKIRLLPSGEFLLSAGSLSYLTHTSAPDASVRLKSVILQGHNYDPSNTSVGVTYDIYWDNFTYNDTYASGMCEGAIAYTYDYADCSGLPYAWTYTYTVDHVTAPVVPADGALTVECLTSATTPATPAVVDVCGANVPAVLVSTVDSPNLLTCEGSRTYNYTYTDCSGLVSNWKYVYTIAHTTSPSESGTPVATSGGTVECVASATAPANLPVVKDVCGNTLTPSAPTHVGSTYVDCEGTYNWVYTYTDCANKQFVWTYTYTIDHITAPVVPAPGASTVSCPAQAVAPLSIETLDQQQTSQSTGANNRMGLNTGVGQSFTPSISGKLTKIDVFVHTIVGSPTFSLVVYAGNGKTGSPIFIASGYSISSTGWMSLTLPSSTAPSLASGTQYTFWLTAYPYNSVEIGLGDNVYLGGVSWDECTTCTPSYLADFYTDYDCMFKTYMNTAPVVTDVCGTVIPTPTPVVSIAPECEGTITYTYNYADCSGLSTPWVYTYTIDYSGGLTPPANTTATVSCPSAATDPGAPAEITDACGRTVSAVADGSTSTLGTPACNGTVVWKYKYTACDGTTTANWTKTYTVLYSGGLTAPDNVIATVSCPSAATDPGAPADITDACGRTVSAVADGSTSTLGTPACNGTVVWKYKYTACDGTTTANWTKTYTVTYSGGLTAPANGASTVSGPAHAVDPGAPADITDACGRSVSAVLVGSSTPPVCDGTVVWTYRYTACDGTTFANWTYTYTVVKSTLSGTLKYNNAAQTPMNNVTLAITPAGTNATSITDASGNYSFAGLCPGIHTISVTNNIKPVGGINSTDAGAANYWGANYAANPIERVKFMAGDVSDDNYINATDALRIQQNFVFGTPFDRSKWSYWEKGVISSLNPPTATSFNVALTGNLSNYDLYAMCTGDFNGSFTPGGSKAAGSSLTLAIDGNLQAGPNQAFELPVRAASSMEVGAVSLILNIPSNLVEVTGVSVNGSDVPVTYSVKGNELRIGWNSITPVYTPADGNLLILKLKTKEAFTAGQSITLGLIGNPLNELADGSFNAIGNADLVVKVVENLAAGIGQTGANKLALSNYPNPFGNLTTVSYTIPVDGKVVLEVYTMLGQHVATLVEADQTTGNYSLKFNGESMQQGIYTVRLRLIGDKANLERSIKFVIQK